MKHLDVNTAVAASRGVAGMMLLAMGTVLVAAVMLMTYDLMAGIYLVG